jgi:hypothetical protein
LILPPLTYLTSNLATETAESVILSHSEEFWARSFSPTSFRMTPECLSAFIKITECNGNSYDN